MWNKLRRLIVRTAQKAAFAKGRFVDTAERRAWLERREQEKARNLAQRTAGAAGAQARFWS